MKSDKATDKASTEDVAMDDIGAEGRADATKAHGHRRKTMTAAGIAIVVALLGGGLFLATREAHAQEQACERTLGTPVKVLDAALKLTKDNVQDTENRHHASARREGMARPQARANRLMLDGRMDARMDGPIGSLETSG